MSNSPLLSICIPTFNNSKGVKKIVECLLDNTDSLTQMVEFCISDNSGDSDTEKIVNELRTKYLNKIHYSKNKTNLGYDRNMDKVLQLAYGRYCWLLSDNELPIQNALDKILNEIKTAPEIALFVVCEENTPREKIITYPNMEAAMHHNNLWIPGGLVSRNIIKRSLIPEDKRKYFDNDWMHLSLTLHIGGDRPMRFIPEIFINNKFDKCKWAKDGKTFTTYTNLLKIIQTLPTPPYTTSFIRKISSKMQSGIPHQILSAKIYGLKINRNTFYRIYYSLRDRPILLLLSMATILIPSFIVRYAKSLKHNFSR